MGVRADPTRLVTVWCPDWAVVAAELPADGPAAVFRANRVVARSAAAAADGVQHGQRRREAQRRCPDLQVVDHDADRDATAFEPVARAITRFAPRLEVVEPGWACVAARGPSRYFGGDGPLAVQVADAVRAALRDDARRVPVRIGIADGRFASTVAARSAGDAPMVVAPGGSPAFVAPLPIGWLARCGEADVDLVGLFTRLGLHHLGALAALDPADVAARFGPAGRHVHRLAAGLDPRGTDAVAPDEPLGVEQTFDGPVTVVEPLVFTAKALADDLAAQLFGRGLTCTRLTVSAETDHGEHDRRAWYRAAGLTAADMVERVRWQLNSWMASGEVSAGVVLLRLEPSEVRSADGEQAAMWGGTSVADERALRAVARLTSLVGDQGVLVPSWVGGRLPADRAAWVPAAAVDLTDPRDVARRLGPLASLDRTPVGVAPGRPDGGPGLASRAADPAAAPWPGSLPTPSPTVVLTEPEPAVLADDAGRPIRVSGRGELSAEPVTFAVADRVPRLVTGWAGPWIVDERWWDVTGRRRVARVQVVCDDGAAFLIGAEHQRWWLLAAYR